MSRVNGATALVARRARQYIIHPGEDWARQLRIPSCEFSCLRDEYLGITSSALHNYHQRVVISHVLYGCGSRWWG